MNTPQLADSLRAAVLQAAIKGELTERSSENARDLLLRIQNEKQALQTKGSLKKAKAPAPVTADEVPFDIPENWVWVRLGEIASKITDGSHNPPPRREKGIPILSAANIFGQKIQFSSANRWVNEEEWEIENKRTDIQINDVLLTIVGTIGRTAVVESETKFALQRSVAVIKPILVNPFYLSFLPQTPYLQEIMTALSKGTAQKGIYLNAVKELPIPLPPLAEQQAIAEKLTRLLAEIDRLKAEEQSLASLQKAYPQTLRASVLAAAVRGDLNERSQEHARDLLLHIQNEKQALQAKGSLKKAKAPAPVTADEVPFDIPENWVWVRLGEIFNIVRGGSPRPIQNFLTKDENGVNWIKIGDTDIGGKYIHQTKEKIIPEGMKKSRLIKSGSLLLTNSMSYGRPYILKTDGCIHDGWLALEPLNNGIDREFIFYVISSHIVQSQFHQTVAGAVVKNLNSDKVKETLIPLPPLFEQQTIVEKLTALLAEIDALENA